MRPSARNASLRQRGAALVIVLVLIVTLSFIVLAVTDNMALAAHRAINARERSQAIWRAFGVETLASAALTAAARETPGVMKLDDPWVERPFEAPMEDGVATIWFSDATRCINVNALVVADGDGAFQARPAGAAELAATLEAVGASGGDAQTLADLVVDWIDTDNLAGTNGAEDSYYTARPIPYRTGATLLADRSELRALAEIDAEFYLKLLKFVCVQPTISPSPVNINMLRPEDAPLLSGMLGGAVGIAAARDVIADRPPGGYASAELFWAHPAFAGLEISEATKDRVKLYSRYIEARAKIAYDSAVVNATLVFEIDDAGTARLISRRWGND
ncbi:MAG: type II secretion system minor pseudopilin GspK [Pseudomonadota bacterium]|nr:type II secretion system minor pseudopilin GspK [Pseudomonadota bacterium]